MRFQRDENVAVLLNANADVNLADAKGETPLMVAAQAGRMEYVLALLDKGAEVSTSDPDGNTALYYAIFEGYDDIAKHLIQAGTKVYGLNNGYTLLHWAQVMGRKEVVAMLGGSVTTQKSEVLATAQQEPEGSAVAQGVSGDEQKSQGGEWMGLSLFRSLICEPN
jgi:ankyrin repeat protein